MAKNKTSELTYDGVGSGKGFGSMDIFAPAARPSKNNVQAPKEPAHAVPSHEKKNEGAKPDSHKPHGKDSEEVNAGSGTGLPVDNAGEVMSLEQAKASPVKKTSIIIKKSSLKFLQYGSKIAGLNQNDYLTAILMEEMERASTAVPDFDSVVEKRTSADLVTKGIQVPEDVIAWAKKQAACELKNLSEYVDDLLQKRISKM
jgi:hypothetical protein